jgi:hypothetical protein
MRMTFNSFPIASQRSREHCITGITPQAEYSVSFSRCQSRYDLDARKEYVFHSLGVPAVIRVHETHVKYHQGAVRVVPHFLHVITAYYSGLNVFSNQVCLKASPCRTIGSIYTFLRLLLAKYRVGCHVLCMQIDGPICRWIA